MFKDRLRATRISRGFTAQALADQLHMSLRNYQKYESGEIHPSLDTLIVLADILNVPTDFLLERDAYLSMLGVSIDVPPNCPPRYTRPTKKYNSAK